MKEQKRGRGGKTQVLLQIPITLDSDNRKRKRLRVLLQNLKVTTGKTTLSNH